MPDFRNQALRAGALAALFCFSLSTTLIPSPNLAKRIETADTIVVAKLVRGTTRSFDSQISTDMVLRVDRILKGDLIPGTEIASHLEGRGMWAVQRAAESVATPLYGIWFLNTSTHPFTVISRDGGLGELYFAPAILPEEAPAGLTANTPAVSVANALAAAMRWIAEVHGSEMIRRESVVSERLGEFNSLLENLRTLDSSTTLPFFKQFASEKLLPLRAAGIQGLIAANEPDGVKRAAADWGELAKDPSAPQIVASLMGYSNGDDPTAVRALGSLAASNPALPGLRENASYALRAIHTKEALPALIALMDSEEERVRSNALAGVCLFVRNAPTVTPESVRSMSWMKSQEPAPYLTPETQPYCFLGGVAKDSDRYVSFWKSWWSAHQAEIETR